MKRSNQFGVLMFIFVGIGVFCYAMYSIAPYKIVIQRGWDPVTQTYYGEGVQTRDYSAWYYPKIQMLMAFSVIGATATVFPLMYFVEKEGDIE